MGSYSFLNNQSRFLQLRSIQLIDIKITSNQIDGMSETLTKLDYLRLFDCQIGENLHKILAFTPNLRYLSVEYTDDGSEWLVHEYPMLERFKFI